MEAFAIKGPNGIEANTVRDSAVECWSDWLIESELTRDVSEARGYRCVPVTVSEKGEAEALLLSAASLLSEGDGSTLYHDQCNYLSSQIHDYLSRGRG